MSSKPPKPTYWEKRAEQKEKLIQGHTTQAVRQIANAYDKANSEITAEIKKIFETYKKEHGLTDAEARQLISHTETKELIQYLKFKLNTIADERIRKDILNRINAVSYAARITRLEALSERVGAIFRQTADIELGTDKSVLGNAYKESYYRTMFDCQQGFGIGADFALIPEKALKTVLESKFMGKNFSERVWTNTNALAKKLKTVLSAGIATGASIEKMSNDIADLSLQGKMMATRLIRTETTFYMGQGELKAYAEFGIDKYKYLATLDSRTSPMCAELDGEVFNVADAVPGENYPPLHAWCRSTTIAYFGDEDTGTRVARDKDSKTYKVPSDMTYDEWKEKYVADAISKSDKEQFEKYKAIIPDLSNKTLEEFYNIKYNDSEYWSFIKLDYSRRNELVQNPELKLPNADSVVVAEPKFTKYLFNPENEKGYNKGKAFISRLGYSIDNWQELQQKIIYNAPKYPAKFIGDNGHGIKYEQRVILYGLKNKPANIVVGWIQDDLGTHLTSLYIKEV